jgi:hypothetical protein
LHLRLRLRLLLLLSFAFAFAFAFAFLACHPRRGSAFVFASALVFASASAFASEIGPGFSLDNRQATKSSGFSPWDKNSATRHASQPDTTLLWASGVKSLH